MSHEKRLLGQFLKQRAKNPDTESDPWNALKESPLEEPNSDLVFSKPAELPKMPAPALSHPGSIPRMPAPDLSSPHGPPRMPAPPLTSPHAPPLMPAPDLRIPNTLPAEPTPSLSVPGALPKMPAPDLSKPSVVGTQIVDVKSQASVLPKMPAPSLGSPAKLPEQPSLSVGPSKAVEQRIPPGGNFDTQYAPGGQLSQENFIKFTLRSTDEKIVHLMKEIDKDGKYAPYSTANGSHSFDPAMYAKSVARLGHHLGKSGLALFAASQFGLFLLNRHGRIWNPLTAIPLPIVQNFIPAALDVLTGTPRIMTGFDDSNGGFDFFSKNHGPGADDRQLKLAKGDYNEVRFVHYPPFIETVFNGGRSGPLQKGLGSHLGAPSQMQSLVDDPIFGTGGSMGRPLVEAALDIRNKYTPDFKYEDHAVITADDLVKDVLGLSSDEFEKTEHLKKSLQTDLLTYSYSSTGANKKAGGGLSKNIAGAANMVLGNKAQTNTGEFRPDKTEGLKKGAAISRRSLSRSAFTRGIIPAKFKGENEFGFIATTEGRSPTDIISDDAAYLPVSFTDLRPIDKSYRTVYLRPLNLKLSEAFTPQWNKAQYFGRVDPTATYESTGRQFSVSFDLIAFGPEDIKTIYQKLNWITSMVYPTYDKNLLYVSGPVVRMRVGDVMNAIGPEGCLGLPGIIENLDFNYNDSLWELESGLKVPRNIGVSLSFTVLHDRPIGVGADGKFGGLGTIRDGRYYPPGASPAPSAGDAKGIFPDVIGSSDSFRSMQGIDMNGYEKFRDSNSPTDKGK